MKALNFHLKNFDKVEWMTEKYLSRIDNYDPNMDSDMAS